MSGHTPWDQIKHKNGCDNCGRLAELYHNEDTGLALCEDCDRATDRDQPGSTLVGDRDGLMASKAETILREFIKSHTLAVKMVAFSHSSSGQAMYTHDPDGCKHCEALKALDELVAQLAFAETTHDIILKTVKQQYDRVFRNQKREIDDLYKSRYELIEMIQDQAKRAEKAEEELEVAQEQADAAASELQACNVQLHDQKQHELGAQCAELQGKIDRLVKFMEDSSGIPNWVVYEVKRQILDPPAEARPYGGGK
jgi:hypothetical protein